MNARRKEIEVVALRAAELLVDLERGDPQARTEITRWLKQSPLHVRELLLAREIESHLSEIDPERRIDFEALVARASAAAPLPTLPVHQQSESTRPRGRRRTWHLNLAAGVLLLSALLWSVHFFSVDVWGAHIYATAVGEQRTITLADGSVVQLNAQSRVRVRYSREARDIELLEGAGLFSVRRDPSRPFRVHADHVVVQAIGTQFEVDRRPTGTVVSVLAGRVELQVSPVRTLGMRDLMQMRPPQRLEAGELIRVADAGRISPPQRVDVSEVAAWRQRRLVFHLASLAEIAAEFARHTPSPRIEVEGEALRAQRYSAVFDAHRPESLVRFLERDPTIAVKYRGDTILVRPRAEQEAPSAQP